MEQQTGSKEGKEYVKADTVTLLIQLICKIYHEKCWAEGSKAGVKISGRNINNLTYTDDTTLMAES